MLEFLLTSICKFTSATYRAGYNEALNDVEKSIKKLRVARK